MKGNSMTKVVVNKCYGGFGLSDAAYERLIELGIPLRKYIQQKRGEDGRYLPEPQNEGFIIFDRDLEDEDTTPLGRALTDARKRKSKSIFGNRYWESWTRDIENRSHPLVVQVVEELGAAASDELAKLKVVEVPEGVEWELDEYDGIESVREKSRSFG